MEVARLLARVQSGRQVPIAATWHPQGWQEAEWDDGAAILGSLWPYRAASRKTSGVRPVLPGRGTVVGAGLSCSIVLNDPMKLARLWGRALEVHRYYFRSCRSTSRYTGTTSGHLVVPRSSQVLLQVLPGHL